MGRYLFFFFTDFCFVLVFGELVVWGVRGWGIVRLVVIFYGGSREFFYVRSGVGEKGVGFFG